MQPITRLQSRDAPFVDRIAENPHLGGMSALHALLEHGRAFDAAHFDGRRLRTAGEIEMDDVRGEVVRRADDGAAVARHRVRFGARDGDGATARRDQRRLRSRSGVRDVAEPLRRLRERQANRAKERIDLAQLAVGDDEEVAEQFAVAVEQLDVVLQVTGREPLVLRLRRLIGQLDAVVTAIEDERAAANEIVRALHVVARRVVRERLVALPRAEERDHDDGADSDPAIHAEPPPNALPVSPRATAAP